MLINQTRALAFVALSGLSVAAKAIPLLYVGSLNTSASYIYQTMTPPAVLGPAMTVYTKPFYHQATFNRSREVLLNYLRAHWDPQYWNFRFGGDLQAGDITVLDRKGYANSTSAIQGYSHLFGLNQVDVPFGSSNPNRPKEFIYMERVFSNNTHIRVDIKVPSNNGTLFRPRTDLYQHSSGYYQEAVEVRPFSGFLTGYNPGSIVADYLGDLFIADDFFVNTPSGRYHDVVIYDCLEVQFAYRFGSIPNPLPRPYDPEEYPGGDVPF